MKKLLLSLFIIGSFSTFANTDGLCTAKYKTTSITENPALIDLIYGDERAYSAKDKQTCLCAIAKSIDSIQRNQAVEVKSVKVRWMPGKIVGNYAVYEKTKTEKFSSQEILNTCN
jgi:hypothetical protein